MPTMHKLAVNPLNSCQRLYPSMNISVGSPSARGGKGRYTDPHGKSISNQADRHCTDADKRGCLSRSRPLIFTCLPMASLLLTSGISAPPAAPVKVKTTIVSDGPKRVSNVCFWHKSDIPMLLGNV